MAMHNKSTYWFFPVMLLITLYKVVLTLSLWMKSSRVNIQLKANEQYFPVVLFITVQRQGGSNFCVWMKF